MTENLWRCAEICLQEQCYRVAQIHHASICREHKQSERADRPHPHSPSDHRCLTLVNKHNIGMTLFTERQNFRLTLTKSAP